MDILKNLFYGFPDLWGGGVAHSVLILALVITLGLSLGKLRVKGVSLGLAWILFIGLIFGHFSLNLDEHLLHFLKEFGLILFVYSIGLEVGPGFFASFKNGGKSLNLLSIIVVALSIVTTLAIFSFSGTSITSMAGILSGAVTNTPDSVLPSRHSATCATSTPLLSQPATPSPTQWVCSALSSPLLY